MKKRYVWLNIATGEFSDSWDEELQKWAGGTEALLEETRDINSSNSWKLIEYECLNDENFEFYNMMKIK